MSASTNIASRAMLADLTIKQWGASTADRKASATVYSAHNTDPHAGRFNKRLLPQQPAALALVRSIQNAAGIAHRRLTLPWHDGGHRILPRAMFHAYSEEMRTYREKLDAAVQEFVAEYPRIVTDASKRLGDLFDPSDYPSANDIAHRFAMHVQFMPLPTGDDFRIALDAEEQTRLRAAYETDVAELLDAARRDTYQRVQDALDTFATRLYRMHVQREAAESAGQEKKLPTVRDSLVELVREVCDLLPALNIFDDPKLEALRKDIMSSIVAIKPAELRTDSIMRKNALDEADRLMKQVQAYMG